MSVFPFVIWILLELLITKELYALQCELGTYHRYRKDGRERCKKCTLCNAGEGWNTSVEITVDAEHGYLECYRCVECLKGFYRPIHSASQTCYKCQLDCKRLNRYGSVSCGYDSPGHCGDCMSGFKAESRVPNDICFKTDVRAQTTEMNVPTSSRPQTPWPLDAAQIVLLILGSATTVVVIVITLTVLICRWFKKCGTGPALSSEEGLLAADKSSPVSKCDIDTDKSSPVSKCDIDTDGPQPVPERADKSSPVSKCDIDTDSPQPVPERAELWSSNECDIIMAKVEFSNSHHVVDRAVGRDDETLSVIATTISGKNVPKFFDYLQIHRCKTDPEEELWERGKITYSNFILNVLVEWTKSAHPFPNLAWLCDALQTASFHEVVEQILALKENQIVVND
ncbi:uncharacterized protein LOC128550392 isoform X2 [Mercenaria mercenaria]|uniref:uncharacterized protein LOC128550392 isoform X2 n=1 Tax=Mercenaria mercenaria TaxID=6596 RepID=UPI00234E6A25|nr:uncharacterized protein LOC128550392 isoform X2 [Mercenaria mercenaria]